MVRIPPPPYSMCSQKECEDRVRFGEVSWFECHDGSRPLPLNQRTIDPRRAVSKYRRSAAGSSTEDRYPVRSMDHLSITVDYLLEILAEQAPPAPEVKQDVVEVEQQETQERQRESMLATVSFVEDRLRAVQVDLVKLQHPVSSRALQVRMTRCHILILYLMGDCPTYEIKFGCTALQTSLSSYFAASSPSESNVKDSVSNQQQDEMLSYTILFAVRQDLLEAGHDKGNIQMDMLPFTSSTLGQYRMLIHAQRHQPTDQHDSKSVSLFQWTLTLVVHVLLGHWHVALRHLLSYANTDEVALQSLNQQIPPPVGFVIRAQCLLAPCLQYMRLEALKAYNVSFGKGEAVPSSHVAHLLQIHPTLNDSTTINSTWDDDTETPLRPSHSMNTFNNQAADAAMEFGRSVGLPVDDKDKMLFKVVASSSLRIHSTRKVRNDEDGLVLFANRSVHDALKHVRIDDDGIIIPPPDWIRNLVSDDFPTKQDSTAHVT